VDRTFDGRIPAPSARKRRQKLVACDPEDGAIDTHPGCEYQHKQLGNDLEDEEVEIAPCVSDNNHGPSPAAQKLQQE